MTTQHTPGPWKANEDSVIGPKGNVIAECLGYSIHASDSAQRAQGGRESNARLIASAPDLLVSCQQLIDAVEILCADEPDLVTAWQPTLDRAYCTIAIAEATT